MIIVIIIGCPSGLRIHTKPVREKGHGLDIVWMGGASLMLVSGQMTSNTSVSEMEMKNLPTLSPLIIETLLLTLNMNLLAGYGIKNYTRRWGRGGGTFVLK